jgi:hypothetical protein
MIVQTEVLKPAKIIGWVASGVMLLYAYIIFSKGPATSQKDIVVLVIGILITAGLFFIQRSYIILDNNGITHKQPGKQKFIAYRDIVFADLVTHYHGHGYSVMWEIKTSDGKTASMIPYGKKNMRKMAEALAMKLPGNALGERVVKLAEGKRVIFF